MTSARERFDGTLAGDRRVRQRDRQGVGKHTLVEDLQSGYRGSGVGKQSLVEQLQRKLAGSVGADVAEHPTAVADAATLGAAGVQRKLGASQASGIHVREISTGRTGAITGKLVWGKHYPVRWDDGKSSQVDANDDNYEVVASTAPASTAPASTTPAGTPPASTASTSTPSTAAPTSTPSTSTPSTSGKQPDRDITHFDDEDFQEQWTAKQDEVHAAVQAFVPKFQALDPDAEVRIRGSIATGVKANPAKVDPVSGKRLLFNPTDFDIDAYIASDKLYNQALTASGSSDAAVRGKIPGSRLPAVNAIIREMRVALAKIAGNRDAPKALQYRFNVIIRSVRNDKHTIQQDRRDMGGPLTIEPPESD